MYLSIRICPDQPFVQALARDDNERGNANWRFDLGWHSFKRKKQSNTIRHSALM